LIKEYAIPKDLVQTGQWFVAIQNSATVQLNCVGFAFVARTSSEIPFASP
jgi:hypothetical protein